MDNNTIFSLVNVVIVCIILVLRPIKHARKPTHSGTVYHSVQHAFVCDVGFVLADNTADGGCRCRIVRIDKPLAGGGSVDCTAERVKACQTAQITGGTDGLAVVAAAQGDKQIIGGKTVLAIDIPIALYRHSVNTHEICVGLACGQLCRHAVDAGIGICRIQPIINLCNKGGCCFFVADQRFFAAAARDSAVVGARDAAHKAVTRRDDAARAVAAALGGDIAVDDFGIVAARNAAHMAGTGELFVCGLGRGDVADTADLQFDVFDLTAGDCVVVQTGNAAHRAAGAARTDGNKAVRACLAAHRAGIGTLIQGTVVPACDAAQICIFIKILCKVQQNVGAADLAALRGAAHRAAQRDGVDARAQAVVQRQRAVFDLTAGDGALVHARKAADGDRRGAELHVGVLRQLHIADGRVLAVVRRNSADALRRAGDRAVAYAAAAFQLAVLADDAEVRGRDAARRAVGRGDVGTDLHILNQRVFIIIARDAARLAVGGVDLILGMDAGADFAARGVLARNTARIFCAGAHRGVVIHTGDFGAVRTGHAARVVGGGDAAQDRAVGVVSAVNAALIRIDTGHAARIAGGGDTALQLAGQRDIADVGTGHAARVLVGLYRDSAVVLCADDEALAGAGLGVTAQVDARNAADIAVTAHGTALRRVSRLNKTAVDARNAAQIGIPSFTVAEGRRHPAAGDRALVPARKAARGALVSHCAVVCAVFQRCVGCGIADDTARQCAVHVDEIIAAIGQRVQRYAAFKRAVVGRVQAADGQGVLLCAVGCILNRQLRIGVVCADDAADVDVGLQVELVLEVGKDDLVVRRFHGGAVGQHAGALVNRRQQRLQRDVHGLGRQQTVVADDAARDGVGLDAARGHICVKRAARHGEAAHRQVGADDAADKLLTRHAADLHSGGGQLRRAVQADHAADSLARRHDLAADGQFLAGGVGNRRLFIVITGHAAHVVVAVQDGTQRRGSTLIPRHNAFFAVAARDAADVVGVAARGAARGAAQLL